MSKFNFILFLPCKILGKLDFIWHYIYKSYFFSSERKIEKLLILNKIKTITFEESAPSMIVSVFYKIAKKHNITVINMSSGLRTIKGRKLSKDKLKYCDGTNSDLFNIYIHRIIAKLRFLILYS